MVWAKSVQNGVINHRLALRGELSFKIEWGGGIGCCWGRAEREEKQVEPNVKWFSIMKKGIKIEVSAAVRSDLAAIHTTSAVRVTGRGT